MLPPPPFGSPSRTSQSAGLPSVICQPSLLTQEVFIDMYVHIYTWPPSRGSEQWPWLSWTLWFYSARLGWTAGCDRAVLPTLHSSTNARPLWEVLIAGARMFFWFPLRSLYVLSSQFTRCLSFVGAMWLGGAGTVRNAALLFPQRRCRRSNALPAKRTAYAHHSKSIAFCSHFVQHPAEQKLRLNRILVKNKQ